MKNVFEAAREAVVDLLPLLTDIEREFVEFAVARSPVNLKIRLADWSANHANAEVRTKAQQALDALTE